MSPELALLYELWDKLKSHLPKKDRVDLAEEIVRTFDEHIDISDAEAELNSFDSMMKAAIVSHFDLGYEDPDDDDDDWDY